MSTRLRRAYGSPWWAGVRWKSLWWVLRQTPPPPPTPNRVFKHFFLQRETKRVNYLPLKPRTSVYTRKYRPATFSAFMAPPCPHTHSTPFKLRTACGVYD